MSITHEDIMSYFRNYSNGYSVQLYNELKSKYNVEVIFSEKKLSFYEEMQGYIPGNVEYIDGRWFVRIVDDPRWTHRQFDRVLSHELLHILLRYRYEMPFSLKGKKGRVIQEIEHRIMNPMLDKEYGSDVRKVSLEVEEMMKFIGLYLEEVNEEINRNKYIETIENCLKVLENHGFQKNLA